MKKELEKILENEEFVKELMLKETRDEAKKAIEEKGVSVTDEEMEEIHNLYSAIYEECKKMSKKDLEKISGGSRDKEYRIGDGLRAIWKRISPPSAMDQVRQNARNEFVDVANHSIDKLGEETKKGIDKGIEYVFGSGNDLSPGAGKSESDPLPQGPNYVKGVVIGVGAVAAAGIAYKNRKQLTSWIKSHI